jgi:hypothetical protein
MGPSCLTLVLVAAYLKFKRLKALRTPSVLEKARRPGNRECGKKRVRHACFSLRSQIPKWRCIWINKKAKRAKHLDQQKSEEFEA